jgi:outer membrane protein
MRVRGFAKPVGALFACGALSVLATFNPAQAQSLEEALAAARDNNPTLREAELGLRSAGEARWQARADYLPSVSVNHSVGASASETTFGGATTGADLAPQTTSVRVTQEIYTGGRRRAQSELSRATVESARHDLKLTEHQVILDVVAAYAGVRRDEAVLRARELYVEGLSDQVIGARRRVDVGEITVTDLALTEARLAQANALLADARAALQASRGRFTQAAGIAPEALEAAPEPAGLPSTLEDLIFSAERLHPAVLRAQQSEAVAHARLGIERSTLRPQISLVGQANRQEEASRPGEVERGESAAAQVSLPLFEGGFGRSRVRQSRIDVSRAQADVETVRRQVVADAIERWSQAEASQQRRRAAGQQSTATAQAVRGAERELAMGLRSTLDVLNTREEWQEALVAEARAEADQLVSAYAVLAAAGTLSFEALAPQP